MTTTRSSERPKARLLWDEQLSHRVANALRVLGFRVTWVGAPDDGVPSRGSSDAVVIEYALRTNQIIVTQNHDMMALCHEAGQRFVWMDPRRRQLRYEEQVVLVFSQISQWERILTENPGQCVLALRTKCSPIDPDMAVRRAVNRMRELKRRQRKKAIKPPSPPIPPAD